MHKRLAHAFLIAGFAGLGSSGALAQAPTTRPALLAEPWNEDWSSLKNPGNRADLFDPIKYIPLNSAGDVYLSLGGQVRERYELFNNSLFGAGPQDNGGYFLTRLLAHGDLHVGSNLRFYAEILSAMEDDRSGGPRATDSNEIDLRQAFADFRIPFDGAQQGVTFRVGRQDLSYGAQRLIGPLDWSNTRRTFEGVRGMLSSGSNQLDFFWVRPVIVDNEGLDNGDGNTSFAGLYDTLALPHLFDAAARSKLELYGLLLNRASGPAVDTAPAIAADVDVYTIGARLSSTPKPFDFDIEADYQFGEAGAGPINAYSIAADVGYTFANVSLTPRINLGFDLASGDRDAGDADVQTFNQLFPTGHLYFGYIDVIGRQNIVDFHPGLQLSLLKNAAYARSITLRADYHFFWRQSDDDGVYNAAGGLLRGDLGSDERSIGSELDLLLSWQVDNHLSSYVGYSHFFAGGFLDDTGPSEDVDFLYAAVQYTF
jgi:hypothetical protein